MSSGGRLEESVEWIQFYWTEPNPRARVRCCVCLFLRITVWWLCFDFPWFLDCAIGWLAGCVGGRVRMILEEAIVFAFYVFTFWIKHWKAEKIGDYLMEEYVDIRAEYAQPALPVVLQSSIHPNLWVELDGCFWLWVAARSGAKQVLFPFGIFVCPRNMIFCFATRQLVGRDIKLRPRKLGTGRGRWTPHGSIPHYRNFIHPSDAEIHPSDGKEKYRWGKIQKVASFEPTQTWSCSAKDLLFDL